MLKATVKTLLDQRKNGISLEGLNIRGKGELWVGISTETEVFIFDMESFESTPTEPMVTPCIQPDGREEGDQGHNALLDYLGMVVPHLPSPYHLDTWTEEEQHILTQTTANRQNAILSMMW